MTNWLLFDVFLASYARVSNSVIKRIKNIIFGEALYDCFPNGNQVAGGAPFNVAWGLRGFGHDATLLSAVGDDLEGKALRDLIRGWGLDDSVQVNASHSTGKVIVSLSGGEANYTIQKPCAWDFIDDASLTASDLLYHGSLALRSPYSRSSFETIVERSGDAVRFFDINLRAPHYTIDEIKQWMHGADWVKLNLDELKEITGLNEIEISDIKEILAQLKADFKIENLLLTGGEQGAVIYGNRGYAAKIPAPSPSVMIDTVGAGDGFTAMTLNGIIKGYSLDQIVQMASTFASKICQIQGATSQDPNFYK